MNKNNMIDEEERKSLHDMIVDDIEFVTGKNNFTYFFCFGINEGNSGLNIITNILPGKNLSEFVSNLNHVISQVDTSKVDTHKDGCIEYTVKL